MSRMTHPGFLANPFDLLFLPIDAVRVCNGDQSFGEGRENAVTQTDRAPEQ
jgi:hypothetical protein